MNKVKQLAGDTVLYGLGSIVPRVINFFLIALHTRVFTNPEAYGVITNLYAYVGFLNIVYMFGMETAYFRFATKPGADEPRIFNIAQTAVVTISVALSLAFIITAVPLSAALGVGDKPYYIYALTLVMLTDAVVALPFARLRLRKKALTFAAAKITNVLLLVALNYVFLTQVFDPAHALGVFGACYKLAVLMNLAVQAFRFAAEPFFFSHASDRESPALFARINHYFIVVCCFILLGVSINLDILKHFLGSAEYWEGLNIVPVLLLAYLFLGIYYNLTVWFKLTDRTYYGTLIALGGAGVTILANYLLIPIAGYTGSSVAALLCYVFMTAMCYYLGQKYYPIPYHVVRALAYIIITTVLVYGVNLFVFNSQLVATLFHTIVMVIYAVVVYRIERDELIQITRPLP